MGDPNSGGPAWCGIGTGGWGSSPNAKVNFWRSYRFPSGNQWSGVITLNISSYQGTYRIHLGQYLQGATWKDPYKAWRNNYVKKKSTCTLKGGRNGGFQSFESTNLFCLAGVRGCEKITISDSFHGGRVAVHKGNLHKAPAPERRRGKWPS